MSDNKCPNPECVEGSIPLNQHGEGGAYPICPTCGGTGKAAEQEGESEFETIYRNDEYTVQFDELVHSDVHFTDTETGQIEFTIDSYLFGQIALAWVEKYSPERESPPLPEGKTK